MSQTGMAWLMYHELASPGRPTCRQDPGYLRYVVEEHDFRAQMAALHAAGFRGINAGQALQAPANGEPAAVITFDDGSETDLLIAAPILREFGFGATFYAVAGFVGRPGYLSAEQLRDLLAAGFEVAAIPSPILTWRTSPK